MIRFDRIRARNMGVLRDVDIDLASIPGTLVAVTGPNGAGKSTLLGCLAAAMYREAPTRGSLVDLANSRSASLEVSLVHGQPWAVKHLVDGASKKSEAVAIDASGASATDSGKVRSFDAWASKALPRPEVFLSSVFMPQGSRGFLGLSPSERKGVLLRVLGVERLETLASLARERRDAAKWQRELVIAKIAGVGDADLEGAGLRAEACAARVAEAALVVQTSTEDLAQAEQARANAASAWEAVQAHTQQLEDLAVAKAAAASKAQDLARRIANNRALLERAGEVRSASARVAAIDVELATVIEEHRGHERGAATCTQSREAARRRADACGQRESEAQRRVSCATSQIPDVARAVEEAERTLPAAHEELAAATAAVSAIDAERGALRSRHVAGLGERVTALRAGITESLARFPDPMRGDLKEPLSDALRDDDAAALAAVEVPPALADVERRLAAAEARARTAEACLARLERGAGRRRELDGLLAAHAQANDDLRRAIDEGLAAREELAALQAAHEALSQAAGQADARRATLEAERAPLERVARDLAHVDAAEARIAELEPQLADAQAAERAAGARIAELGPAPFVSVPDAGAVLRAKAALTEASQAHTEAVAALGAATAAVDRVRTCAARLDELRAERARHDDDVADWTRLADDLGRDGLQAAEIDAAGPELTELVNDLLRTCVGPRWTVTVETQRLSSDGKKLLEGLEVRVVDTERGREAPAETLSGGELVLVGEAVSLAITMLACRRAGVRGATLIRDESGAALDPSAARSYVAMLRRAAQIVGARQVLVVSHSAEVVEMADARIVLDGGRASVC